MRFSEIISEAQHLKKGRHADVQHFDAPGYFTVGDSHSNGVGAYGDGPLWKAMGMDGAPSTNSMHISAINRIPKGSIVAISLGANDLSIHKSPIPDIVSRVQSIIDYAKSKGLKVVYLIPTGTKDPRAKPGVPEARDALRKAMMSNINVPTYDLGYCVGKPSDDGLHRSMSFYASIGKKIVNDYTIDKSVTNKPVTNKLDAKQDKFDYQSELDKLPP
jgi:hypothetical protein